MVKHFFKKFKETKFTFSSENKKEYISFSVTFKNTEVKIKKENKRIRFISNILMNLTDNISEVHRRM